MAVVEGDIETGVEFRDDEASACFLRHGDLCHGLEVRDGRHDGLVEEQAFGNVDEGVLAFFAEPDTNLAAAALDAKERAPPGTQWHLADRGDVGGDAAMVEGVAYDLVLPVEIERGAHVLRHAAATCSEVWARRHDPIRAIAQAFCFARGRQRPAFSGQRAGDEAVTIGDARDAVAFAAELLDDNFSRVSHHGGLRSDIRCCPIRLRSVMG